jgi:hypothetical protein
MLLVLASLAMIGDWGSAADFLAQWITSGLYLAVVVFGVSRVARLNLLGYFLVLALPQMMMGAEEMLAQPNRSYHAQGLACIAALAVLLVWPIAAQVSAEEKVTT